MVNGTWISELLASSWWLVLFVLGNFVIMLILSEYALYKKDKFRRMTQNAKYAKRLGVDPKVVIKGTLPQAELFELFNLCKKVCPNKKITLKQHHISIWQQHKVSHVLTLDTSLDAGYRELGTVTMINFCHMPSKDELKHAIRNKDQSQLDMSKITL